MDQLKTRRGMALSLGIWSLASLCSTFIVGIWDLCLYRFLLGVSSRDALGRGEGRFIVVSRERAWCGRWDCRGRHQPGGHYRAARHAVARSPLWVENGLPGADFMRTAVASTLAVDLSRTRQASFVNRGRTSTYHGGSRQRGSAGE